MSSKNVTRITLFAKRRPDLSREQFYDYWEKVHAPLTAPWLVKYKVQGYSQIHCFSTGADSASDGTAGPPFEYDGIAQFDVADMKTFGGAFSDPYYVEVIKADEKNFLDPSATLVRTMGPLKEVVSGGKAVSDVSKETAFFENYEGKEEEGKE